jgi:UDP-N-acetylglucosamine 2-epimerase (non-hydrolysing)
MVAGPRHQPSKQRAGDASVSARKRIAVFTGSRADYGLLYWLLKDIEASTGLELVLIVGGMHLAPRFGSTWKEVESDGFRIDARVDMQLATDEPGSTARSVGLGVMGVAGALERIEPDFLIVLGDRYETLAAAEAAFLMRIPIAHIHGGEVTLGAYDDGIRHAITKLSQLHFVAAEIYRQRVIQMGEDPSAVHNVGALGLEHLRRTVLLERMELEARLGIVPGGPLLVATYHPVTLCPRETASGLDAMLHAISNVADATCLLTYPNADDGNEGIIATLTDFAARHADRVRLVRSLGSVLYLSLLKHADAVIGNSSSGIIEAPAFGTPTVDIGSRQRGRLRASSVIHCECDQASVADALHLALSRDFARSAMNAVNPYGSGETSSRIVKVLESTAPTALKHFHDLPLAGLIT